MVLLSVVEEQSEQDQEDNPGSEQDEPGSEQDEPGSEQDEPGTEQDEPGSIQPDGSRWPIKTILTVYLNMKQVYCLLVFYCF